jgi:methionyl aminopeptidase
MYSEEELEKFARAGKITAEARDYGAKLVKPGARLLDIAEKIEEFIRRRGALPAFPANLSINSIAAHYTPGRNDTAQVSEGDVVKVDIGAHVDGYPGDSAVTVCLNKDYEKMCQAAREALEEAIKECRPEARLSDLSDAIENTIKGYGYKPVSNLTGHGVGRYHLHAEPSVPNVRTSSQARLQENQVIAIEPFATDGAGCIKDADQVLIYMMLKDVATRNPDARKIAGFASQFQGLPFAERWIPVEGIKLRLAIRELREKSAIHDYNVLKEVGGGMVSQAEHTVIVQDPPVVTTGI